MHKIIEDGLEDYLVGKAGRDFQAHLDGCGECRAEVSQFEDLSGLLTEFRETEPVAPAPGFYFRVSQKIETQRPVSIWSFFSLDAAFGRRVAFGSLMTLAVVGSILVSTESGSEPLSSGRNAEAVMASHDFSVSHEAGADRDRMFVALASYDRP